MRSEEYVIDFSAPYWGIDESNATWPLTNWNAIGNLNVLSNVNLKQDSERSHPTKPCGLR